VAELENPNMATAKLDAHNARVRDALILPYKRRIASLLIRTDIWKSATKSAAKDAAAHAEAQERARGAIAEIDEQVSGLADIKPPADTKTKLFDAEIDKMKADYAGIRETLQKIASAS
jgi:hypothetical protein